MSTIRVVVADDHPIVRKGLIGFLDRSEEIQVVGEASNGEDALLRVEETNPDVLLLDMELGDMRGIEVVRSLQAKGSKVKTLIISAYEDPVFVQELLSSGAYGYLIKEEAPEIIIEAVKGIAMGEQGYLSRRISAQVFSYIQGDKEQKPQITPREKEVLELVVKGKTNQNIGAALGISEKTVEKYLYSIFVKLEVSSRTEAAVYAVREGLIKTQGK